MIFKWTQLLSDSRLEKIKTKNKLESKFGKNEYESDFRKILSSASFRRLQDKTQVFPLDKNDFIRTRLTHSLETASIAKQLGAIAQQIIPELEDNNCDEENIKSIPNILHNAGLLHDIGNPPFGHFGETVIGDWFKDNLKQFYFKGDSLEKVLKGIANEQPYHDLIHFEGNAQALRLVTKLHYLNSDYGLNLTVSTLNTLIKYPCSSLESNKSHPNIKYHKLGYYYADEEIINKITYETGTCITEECKTEFYRHPLTFLLEAADDIAYTTADLEDAYKKGIFTLQQLMEYLDKELKTIDKKNCNDYQEHYFKECYGELVKLTKATNKENAEWYAIQNWMEYIRQWLIYCVIYGFQHNYKEIMNGEFQKELIQGTNLELVMKALKIFTSAYVFPNRSIISLELAAKTIIESLLEKFVPALIYYDYKDEFHNENYKQSKADKKLTSLLSQNHVENYHKEAIGKSEEEKLYLRLLLVTDFISGMTDTYAKQLYQELNGIY